jgi:hypothetical protein
MSITQPYYRICRPFTAGHYMRDWNDTYLRDPRYADDIIQSTRAYRLLESDFIDVLSYIEPSDTNLDSYSHRLYELLLRACTEFEANAKAILKANGYNRSTRWTISDYANIERACRLSEFATEFPIWTGTEGRRKPFAAWASASRSSPAWYQAYNEVKHDRSRNFPKASLRNVVDAVSAVLIILFAQFNVVAFNPYGTMQFYNENPSGALSHPECFLRIKLPTWTLSEMYDFDWAMLRQVPNPFVCYTF